LKIKKPELYKQYERLIKSDRGFLETGKYIPQNITRGALEKFIDNYMKLEENTGRKIDPTIFEAIPYISDFIKKNVGKTIDENLDIELNIPQSLFEQKQTVAPGINYSGILPTPDTGPGSVVTGQGPTIQGQGSTLGQTDVRFRKGTLTDPTERLIAGVD